MWFEVIETLIQQSDTKVEGRPTVQLMGIIDGKEGAIEMTEQTLRRLKDQIEEYLSPEK